MVTSFPLERILRNREATGRIVEWALELSGFDLTFVNSSTIKSKVLADFVAEWTPTPEDDKDLQEASSLPGTEDNNEWTLYFDGSFSLQGAGGGGVLVSPTGEVLKYAVQML